jgi:RNA polymerase sigma factor (sigma-70 family)
MATRDNQAASTSLALLEGLRQGDESAAEEVFALYFERLVLLARSRLSTRLARRADPEDIVLSVYRSFFVGARRGRFQLRRGGDLWRLLASITKHKVLRQARNQRAERRSVEVEVSLDRAEEGRLPGRKHEPSAEEALFLADELEGVFAALSALGRRVLELRLQGSRLSEIAKETGRSERTIRRALGQIREILAERLDHA